MIGQEYPMFDERPSVEELEKHVEIGGAVRDAMKHPGVQTMWSYMQEQLNRFRDSYDHISPDELRDMQNRVTVIREVLAMPQQFIDAGKQAQEQLELLSDESGSRSYL